MSVLDSKQKEQIEEQILEELEKQSAERSGKDKNVKIEIEDEALGSEPENGRADSDRNSVKANDGETSAAANTGDDKENTPHDPESAESLDTDENTEEAAAENDNGQSIIDEKRGFFGGKKKDKAKDKTKEKIDALTAQIAELQDKDLRRQAEFDNFRKRTEKEKSQRFESGEMSVIEHILPVIDNFERGFSMVEESDKDDAFVDGMNKVYKQLMGELEKIGVKTIESVGKPFDPNLHNAVMQVDTGEYESGVVAQEMQKGYMLHDTVIRHSMVAVQS